MLDAGQYLSMGAYPVRPIPRPITATPVGPTPRPPIMPYPVGPMQAPPMPVNSGMADAGMYQPERPVGPTPYPVGPMAAPPAPINSGMADAQPFSARPVGPTAGAFSPSPVGPGMMPPQIDPAMLQQLLALRARFAS